MGRASTSRRGAALSSTLCGLILAGVRRDAGPLVTKRDVGRCTVATRVGVSCVPRALERQHCFMIAGIRSVAELFSMGAYASESHSSRGQHACALHCVTGRRALAERSAKAATTRGFHTERSVVAEATAHVSHKIAQEFPAACARPRSAQARAATARWAAAGGGKGA